MLVQALRQLACSRGCAAMDKPEPNPISGSIIAAAIVCAGVSATAQQPAPRIDIAAMPVGTVPLGCTVARTGSGGDAEWRVVADPSAASGKAIAQTSSDTTDYRFPLAIYDGFTAANLEVAVHFKPIAGRIDQAGGIAIRLASP